MNPSREEGIIEVLLERFERHRLPRILAIKDNVDQGNTLTDVDTAYLEEAFKEALENKHLIDTHPEFQNLYARAIHLYREITDKALANEQST